MFKPSVVPILILFCSVGTINAISLTDVLDIFTVAKDVTINLAKTWNIISDYTEPSDETPSFLISREKKLLNKITLVNTQLQELSKKYDQIGDQTMTVILRSMPARIRLELKLNDFRDYITRVHVAYRHMKAYVNESNSEEIERHTLEDFAKHVVSHDSSSVRSLLERIYNFIVPIGNGFLDMGLLKSIQSFMKVNN